MNDEAIDNSLRRLMIERTAASRRDLRAWYDGCGILADITGANIWLRVAAE